MLKKSMIHQTIRKEGGPLLLKRTETVIGLMKVEMVGKIITKFAAAGSKASAFKIQSMNIMKL